MSGSHASTIAHLAHCNRIGYFGKCKYGEDLTCPALMKEGIPKSNPTSDWRTANTITDWEYSQIGALLCDYNPRDLALMVVRTQGEIEFHSELQSTCSCGDKPVASETPNSNLQGLLDAVEKLFTASLHSTNWSEWNSVRNAMAAFGRSPGGSQS